MDYISDLTILVTRKVTPIQMFERSHFTRNVRKNYRKQTRAAISRIVSDSAYALQLARIVIDQKMDINEPSVLTIIDRKCSCIDLKSERFLQFSCWFDVADINHITTVTFISLPCSLSTKMVLTNDEKIFPPFYVHLVRKSNVLSVLIQI